MSLQSWIFAWGVVVAALLSRRGIGPGPAATTGAQPPDRDLARDARAFLLGIRHHWIIYHNHKEAMAHTAATLYLGAAATIIGNVTLAYRIRSDRVLQVVALFLAAMGFRYVWWQLGNRRYASDVVAACDVVATKWLQTGPAPGELDAVTESRAGNVFPRAVEKALPGAAARSWFKYSTGWSDIAILGTMIVFVIIAGRSVWTADP